MQQKGCRHLSGKTYALEYLELLAKDYPTIQSVSTEIINLKAILNLPKGTEHFISDLHGEYDSVLHVIKSASGVIKNKIDDLYVNTLSESERKLLATIVYYPEQKLYYLKQGGKLTDEWYSLTLLRLVELCRKASSKYTRSKVRKAMPEDFAYILDELLHTEDSEINKHDYYMRIISSIIEIGRADAFVIALANLIRRLSIDHMHILGDIFDRGPRPDIIMDELMNHHSIDIQWGNHDIEWIGAASGNDALIANVVRNSLRYNNLDVLEIGYGINTRTLANFANKTYGDDPCEKFLPIDWQRKSIKTRDTLLTAKMHKAISIIQFKLEAQIIESHPEYEMDERALITHIDYEKNTVCTDGKTYPLSDTHFPTVDICNPAMLTDEEHKVISSLRRSFLHSEKLQKHVRFLITKGGMYKVYNGNLLFHGCIPMDENGEFETVRFFDMPLKGRDYLDHADKIVRNIYLSGANDSTSDFLWYLWCGKNSPLYGKDSYRIFERYFIDDENTHKEKKNNYYEHIEKVSVCQKVFDDFKLAKDVSHIINGHVPVRTGKGESPIKADGRLFVIDGGFSRPYQITTGIAGYTLINNSYGFSITAHEPFTGLSDVLEKDFDLHSSRTIIDINAKRRQVKDTDIGKNITGRIGVLTELLEAYKKGLLREHIK